VSDDNWGCVGWSDHRHIWGCCITTGHWHWIPKGQPWATGYILKVSFTLIGWGRGGRAALLWHQLLLDWGDVNHRVGADFGLRGGNHTDTSALYWSESGQRGTESLSSYSSELSSPIYLILGGKGFMIQKKKQQLKITSTLTVRKKEKDWRKTETDVTSETVQAFIKQTAIWFNGRPPKWL